MTKHILRERALEMRREGSSYGSIKDTLHVSKGTLSVWLRGYPLSKKRIDELRGSNEHRIERCRETKARKRAEREKSVRENISRDIGTVTDREFFISGLFLYWAEGTKAERGLVCMTNMDPRMLIFFIRWLEVQGVERFRLRVKLHLYSDMDIQSETLFWETILGLGAAVFRKPYIKASVHDKPRNYKGRFGHGTCNVFLRDVALYERVMAGIEHLGEMPLSHSKPKPETV